jgi:phage/plasmid-like protein (TIGR03299 family)
MSHEVETMAYAGATPWHGLGEQVSNDLSPAQMMEKAGCAWDVEKRPMTYMVNGNRMKIVPGKKALVRSSDDLLLDVVGDDWNPVQNKDAFNFFSEFVMAGDMEMHTAGSLKEGRNVWALAKIKDSFTILGEDQVDSYLLFSNPHQYGRAIDIRFTPIRVVCNNTLTLSLESKAMNSVKVGHRSVFDPNMVKEALGIASEKFAKYKEMAEFLASKRFTADSLIQYYNEVFPFTHKAAQSVDSVQHLSKTAKEAFAVLETQPGARFGEGTWWQALNSVTYLTDHKLGRSNDSRLQSAWFGINQARKLKAVNKAVEYATAA